MKLHQLIFAGLAIAASTQISLGQIALPISIQAAPNTPNCANFNTNLLSEDAFRCHALSRIALPFNEGAHLFLTVGGLGGRDSAFDNRQNLGATFKGAVAYTGILSEKATHFYLVENTATGTSYTTTNNTLQYLDTARLSLTRLPSARTILSFGVNNIFGNDAIRMLAIEGAGTNIEVASYGIHSGRVLDNQATLSLSHQSTDTRWWSASIRNNFRDLIDENVQANTAHARVEMQFQPSARAGIGAFEETAIETGLINCIAQSIGLVYERRLAQNVAVEGAAAPTFGTKGCISRYSANLYGALSAQPAQSTNLWISAFRKLNDSEVASLTYENNIQGGWMQRFNQNTWFKMHGGMLSGTAAATTPAFRGEYASAMFSRALLGEFTAVASFQYFNWAGVANTASTRNVFTAGLYWSPNRVQPDQGHGPLVQERR